MLDIAAFEANRSLQRRSSSLVSHTKDHPTRSLSKEHCGLMSWPEQFYRQTQSNERNELHVAETDKNVTNLSVKAMQLSMYGSMVCYYHFMNCLFNSEHTTCILVCVHITCIHDFSTCAGQ